MEITGHTSDLDEALDQWEQERLALGEFFTTVGEQEKLLTKLAKLWDEIVPKLKRKQPDYDKINEVIEALNLWRPGVVKAEAMSQENKETWKNLSFL